MESERPAAGEDAGSSEPAPSAVPDDPPPAPSRDPPPAAGKCRHAFCDNPAKSGSPFCAAHGNDKEGEGDGWNCPACGWWVNKGSPCNNPACSGTGEEKGVPSAGDEGDGVSTRPDGKAAGREAMGSERSLNYHRAVREKLSKGYFLPARRKHRHVPSIF